MKEIEEIRKLPPRERIKKLEEIEEKKKKDIAQAEKLIDDSIKEIEESKIKESQKEKEIKTETAEKTLEEEVKTAAPLKEEKETKPEYIAALPYEMADLVEKKLAYDVDKIQYNLNQLKYSPTWGEEEKERLAGIENRLEAMKDNYELSKRVKEQVLTSERVAYNVRKYRNVSEDIQK